MVRKPIRRIQSVNVSPSRMCRDFVRTASVMMWISTRRGRDPYGTPRLRKDCWPPMRSTTGFGIDDQGVLAVLADDRGVLVGRAPDGQRHGAERGVQEARRWGLARDRCDPVEQVGLASFSSQHLGRVASIADECQVNALPKGRTQCQDRVLLATRAIRSC